jgi:hypothetical protein
LVIVVERTLGLTLIWTANDHSVGQSEAPDWFASLVGCCRIRTIVAVVMMMPLCCCYSLLYYILLRHSLNCQPLLHRAIEAVHCCCYCLHQRHTVNSIKSIKRDFSLC